MDARNVILRPVLTEQTFMGMDDKKYTFIVDPRANKSHIKHAIEELFDVDVKKVNIINTARKPKRLGMHQGYRKSRKKAIVTLTEASNEIDLFGSAEDEE
jgi:large subunit ribosomal protein L23